jgi:hypothetical protein
MGVIALAGLLVSGPTAASAAGSSMAVKPKTVARPAPSRTAKWPVAGGRAIVGKAKPAPGRTVHPAFHSSPKRSVPTGGHATTLAKTTSKTRAPVPFAAKPVTSQNDFVRPRV